MCALQFYINKFAHESHEYCMDNRAAMMKANDVFSYQSVPHQCSALPKEKSGGIELGSSCAIFQR